MAVDDGKVCQLEARRKELRALGRRKFEEFRLNSWRASLACDGEAGAVPKVQMAHLEDPQIEAEVDPLLSHLFQQINNLMQEKRALNRANEQLLRENMLLQELLDYLSGDMTQAEQ